MFTFLTDILGRIIQQLQSHLMRGTWRRADREARGGAGTGRRAAAREKGGARRREDREALGGGEI